MLLLAVALLVSVAACEVGDAVPTDEDMAAVAPDDDGEDQVETIEQTDDEPTVTPEPSATPEPTPTPEPESTEEPEAEPTPTAMPYIPLDPTPTPEPPEPLPSEAWLDPEAAILTAARFNGYRPNDRPVPVLRNNAYAIREQYHLLSAEIGAYNRNTHGFLPWLIINFESIGSDAFERHMAAQVRAAFEDPYSEIAHVMVDLVVDGDSYRNEDYDEFGISLAYWRCLIHPASVLTTNEHILENMYWDLMDAFWDWSWEEPEGGGRFFIFYIVDETNYLDQYFSLD